MSSGLEKAEKFWDKQVVKFENVDEPSAFVTSIKEYLTAGDVVLDFGCAAGTVAIAIAPDVKEVHGIDISSKMIEAAKRNAAECGIANVQFMQSTLFDADYAKGSFDMILALNILHLFKDPQEKVMQRISELLRPGGLFISGTACLGEKRSLTGSLVSLLGRAGIFPPVKSFKSAELLDSITHGGFHILKTETPYAQPFHFIVAKKAVNI